MPWSEGRGLPPDWNTGRPARAAGSGGAPKPVQRGGGEGKYKWLE